MRDDTDDQRELRRTVREFLAAKCGPERLRASMATGTLDPAIWRQLAGELGLTALPVAESLGGAGASFAEVRVVLEETGRALLPAPYLSTVVAATVLPNDDGPAAELLAAIAAGTATVALAVSDRGGGCDVEGTATRATPGGGGWRLDGVKDHVLDGPVTDHAVVVAEAGGEPALFALDLRAPGVTVAAYPTLDQTRPLARVELVDARATRVSPPGDAGGAARHLVDVAHVALAAESAGAAERCLEMAVEYLKVRQQFGRPLGAFQALQHRCADLLVDVTAARSTAAYAADAVAAGSDELAVTAPLAKLFCTEAFRRVAAENIQLHGGIGFTWEHDAHLYLKRAQSTLLLLGTPPELRRRIAELADI